MLPLRFLKLWSGLGWLLIAAIVIGSLLPGRVLELIHTSDKILHAGSYFVLMVWFAGFYRRDTYPLLAASLMALGLAVDLLQGLTPTRTFDWRDVGMNCVGVIAGLLLALSLLGGWCQRIEQRLLS